MFAIITGLSGELHHLEFGDRIEPSYETDPHLRWVIDDYPNRRDEQWVHAPFDGAEVLAELSTEYKADPKRLAATILALGWFGQTTSARFVHAHQDNPDLGVRRAVIRAVGQIGNMQSIPFVAKKLEENDPDLRKETIIAAGKFGHPNAIPEMTRRADGDPDLLKRVDEARARLEGLHELKKSDDEPDVSKLYRAVLPTDEYEDLCVWACVEPEPLMRILFDRETSDVVRARTARVLGLATAVSATELLCIPVVNPKDARSVRLECAIALGRIGRNVRIPGITDVLLGALSEKDPPLQDEIHHGCRARRRRAGARAAPVTLGRSRGRCARARQARVALPRSEPRRCATVAVVALVEPASRRCP